MKMFLFKENPRPDKAIVFQHFRTYMFYNKKVCTRSFYGIYFMILATSLYETKYSRMDQLKFF